MDLAHQDWLRGLHLSASVLIFLSFTSIPLTFWWLNRYRRRPFLTSAMSFVFSALLFCAGFARLTEALTVFWPALRGAESLALVPTAALAVYVALTLPRIARKLRRYPTPEEYAVMNELLADAHEALYRDRQHERDMRERAEAAARALEQQRLDQVRAFLDRVSNGDKIGGAGG